MEVLNMSDDAMDMSRLNGAPLLYQHDADKIVGVVERHIKDKRAYAKVRITVVSWRDAELIKDGIIRNVGFGYKINAMDEDRSTDPVTYRATSYQPFEVSLVTVPADNSVGIGHSLYNGTLNSLCRANQHFEAMSETPDIGALRAEAAGLKLKKLPKCLPSVSVPTTLSLLKNFSSILVAWRNSVPHS